jgi:thymidylate kinase
MILVEGPDGAGKTTLIETLRDSYKMSWDSNALQFPDRKSKRELLPNRSAAAIRDEVWEAVCYSATQRSVCVWDRMYFSELVYGKVWRGSVAFSPHAQMRIERVMYAQDVLVILCMPPYDVVRDNVSRTSQDPRVADNIERIYQEYKRVEAHLTQPRDNSLAKWVPQLVVHDYTQRGLKVKSKVKKHIENERKYR